MPILGLGLVEEVMGYTWGSCTKYTLLLLSKLSPRSFCPESLCLLSFHISVKLARSSEVRIYGRDCGDGFKGTYLSLNSSSRIH